MALLRSVAVYLPNTGYETNILSPKFMC